MTREQFYGWIMMLFGDCSEQEFVSHKGCAALGCGLCCAVLCCAVLGCAVLGCGLCCAVLCWAGVWAG
jgi:hypothetical protein